MVNNKSCMGKDKEERGSGTAHAAGMSCSRKNDLCGGSCAESVTPVLFT